MEYVQGSFFEGEHRAPLADRLRPQSLEEYLGQEHILGPGKALRRLIESDQVTSMIFWGPPGVGKTTLAMIIAQVTKARFLSFSATTSGIREIKDIMAKAEAGRRMGERTLLFIDEIHRFNKAQQDAFLPHVENGRITLIGATTENPSFEVNSALLSRSRVFVLEPLRTEHLVTLLRRALTDARGYGGQPVELAAELLPLIAAYANGDARTALNVLEMAVAGGEKQADGRVVVTRAIVEDCMQTKALLYDKDGEEHYNLISALHKSMRNSDPDAAVYWLARMLEAGEDPLYIARRLVRFAAEDVGLADTRALELAVTVYQAVHYLGMPECNLHLTEAVVYLSIAAKSNALYTAYGRAKRDAKETLAEGVPLQLRNAPTKLMAELDYGRDYQYAHDDADKITGMECLPDNLRGRTYYVPTEQGLERSIRDRLAFLKKLRAEKRRGKKEES